jgi:hypothetical protein
VQRFYFHLHNTVEVTDKEGSLCVGLAGAKESALHTARKLMAEDIVALGEITLSHCIEIESEHGLQMLTVRFGDAVRINP